MCTKVHFVYKELTKLHAWHQCKVSICDNVVMTEVHNISDEN